MVAHNRDQQRNHWLTCPTREDLEQLDEAFMTRAAAKVEEGCEHIIVPLRNAFRGESDRAKGPGGGRSRGFSRRRSLDLRSHPR